MIVGTFLLSQVGIEKYGSVQYLENPIPSTSTHRNLPLNCNIEKKAHTSNLLLLLYSQCLQLDMLKRLQSFSPLQLLNFYRGIIHLCSPRYGEAFSTFELFYFHYSSLSLISFEFLKHNSPYLYLLCEIIFKKIGIFFNTLPTFNQCSTPYL